MLYYKFIHDTDNHRALKNIINGFLKFAKIPKLNDFSETFAMSDRKEIDESLAKFRRKGIDAVERNNLDKHLALVEKIGWAGTIDNLMDAVANIGPQVFRNPEDRLNGAVGELPDLLRRENTFIQNKIGIFCVSDRVDSFPMWAHYARNASGLALEFDHLEQLFPGDETGVLNELKKVDYFPDKRPCVPLNPSDLKELFFSKLQDWNYESEWRVILPLFECEPNVEGDDDSWRLFKIDNPEKYIKRIIVGWNGDFEEIRNFVKDKCDIPVVQAKVKDGNIVV